MASGNEDEFEVGKREEVGEGGGYSNVNRATIKTIFLAEVWRYISHGSRYIYTSYRIYCTQHTFDYRYFCEIQNKKYL